MRKSCLYYWFQHNCDLITCEYNWILLQRLDAEWNKTAQRRIHILFSNKSYYLNNNICYTKVEDFLKDKEMPLIYAIYFTFSFLLCIFFSYFYTIYKLWAYIIHIIYLSYLYVILFYIILRQRS